LLASLTFASSAGLPTIPDGWKQMPNAGVSRSNDQTVVWYHFVAARDSRSYTWTWNYFDCHGPVSSDPRTLLLRVLERLIVLVAGTKDAKQPDVFALQG